MTLNDWMLVLQSEWGPAVCVAAGCELRQEKNVRWEVGTVINPEKWTIRFHGHDLWMLTPSTLLEWQSAALAFGTLAVLADRYGGVSVENHGPDGWAVSVSSFTVHSPTLPAAVLAAAKRVLKVE